ncbi:hypothetical protein [uncultured Mediterranean phage]|nr:hypothetical protein [uncultured Mediterranean phage]
MSVGMELVLCLCLVGLSFVLGRWLWFMGEAVRSHLDADAKAQRDYVPPSHWTEEEMYGSG